MARLETKVFGSYVQSHFIPRRLYRCQMAKSSARISSVSAVPRCPLCGLEKERQKDRLAVKAFQRPNARWISFHRYHVWLSPSFTPTLLNVRVPHCTGFCEVQSHISSLKLWKRPFICAQKLKMRKSPQAKTLLLHTPILCSAWNPSDKWMCFLHAPSFFHAPSEMCVCY